MGKGEGERGTPGGILDQRALRDREGTWGEGEINNCNPKDTKEGETGNIENKTARERGGERTGVAVSSAPGF